MHAPFPPDLSTDPEIERIAAALAGPGWCVSEGFLEPGQCSALVAECQHSWLEGDFRPARVGIGNTLSHRPEVRRDQVQWIDANQKEGILGTYLARMEALRLAVNQQMYLGLFGYEGHFSVYPPGAFYRRHLDQFEGVQYRQLSCILYLNDDWEPTDGGALRLYLDTGEQLDILPKGSTLVTFLSTRFEHEVLPTQRQRLSLTGWLRQRAASLS